MRPGRTLPCLPPSPNPAESSPTHSAVSALHDLCILPPADPCRPSGPSLRALRLGETRVQPPNFPVSAAFFLRTSNPRAPGSCTSAPFHLTWGVLCVCVCVCVAAGTRALCIPFPPSLQRSCCRLDHHQTRPAPSAVPVPRSQIRMWVSCGRGHGYPFALRPLSDPTQRPEFPGGPLPPSPKLSSALCLNAARTRSGPPALDPVSAPPIAFTPRFGCARHATLRTGRVSPLAPNPGLTAPRCAFLSPEPGSLHRRPSSPGLWSPPCNARPQSSARPCPPLYFGEVLLAVP